MFVGVGILLYGITSSPPIIDCRYIDINHRTLMTGEHLLLNYLSNDIRNET